MYMTFRLDLFTNTFCYTVTVYLLARPSEIHTDFLDV
jgi:hypothetical protein